MKSSYWFCEKVDFLEGADTSMAAYTCLKNVMVVYTSKVDGVTLILVRTTNGYEYLSGNIELSGKVCNIVNRREEVYR